MAVSMVMTVTVAVATFGIGVGVGVVGAGFGLERRLFDRDLKTESLQHLVEHVIVAVAQPARTDLQCDVPIAQMIGGAGQQAPDRDDN